MDGVRFLEAVARAKKDSTICEAFVAQQCAFIDTILIPVFLREVNALKSNSEVVAEVVIYARIELRPVFVNSVESPWAAGSTDEIF